MLRTNWSQNYRAVRFYFQVECVAVGHLNGRQKIDTQWNDQIASSIRGILAFDSPVFTFSLGFWIHFFLQGITYRNAN
nr:MAG TPA: hypothetical protein [Inoviridae sp.]